MRKERAKNGAIDLSQAGAELKFKVDPATGKIDRRVISIYPSVVLESCCQCQCG